MEKNLTDFSCRINEGNGRFSCYVLKAPSKFSIRSKESHEFNCVSVNINLQAVDYPHRSKKFAFSDSENQKFFFPILNFSEVRRISRINVEALIYKSFVSEI